jgi:hypothetical protein
MEGGKPAKMLEAQFLESRGLGFTVDMARRFTEWCLEQPPETLRADIITLRNAFEHGPDVANTFQADLGSGISRH